MRFPLFQEQIAACHEFDGVRKEKERLTAASLNKSSCTLQRHIIGTKGILELPLGFSLYSHDVPQRPGRCSQDAVSMPLVNE